jgi:hypothetical protein
MSPPKLVKKIREKSSKESTKTWKKSPSKTVKSAQGHIAHHRPGMKKPGARAGLVGSVMCGVN